MSAYRTGLGQVEQSSWKSGYRSLIREIDAESILDHYGASNVYSKDSKYGEQYIHSCLIDRVDPHHSHGDENPSASIQADKKFYHCFTYGGGDLLWLLEIMEGSRESAFQVLQQFATQTSYEHRDILDDLEKLLVVEQSSTSIPSYSMNVLKSWEYHHPYMVEGRGLCEEVLLRHYVGYDPEAIAITLPHFWEGKLVGWQKRRLDDPRWPQTPRQEDGKLAPKYKNTSNFPKNETLYLGEGGEKPGILLVESVLSVLKLESDARHYKQLLPKKIGSTFGAKIGDEQINWIAKNADGPIYLWYDSDLPGRTATRKLIDRLDKHEMVFVLTVKSGEGDAADLTVEEVAGKLESPEFASLAYGELVSEIDRLKRELSSKRS